MEELMNGFIMNASSSFASSLEEEEEEDVSVTNAAPSQEMVTTNHNIAVKKEKKERTKEEASEQMLQQPSYWVTSQKQVKEELVSLRNMQRSDAKYKGVPVLQHYLGKDVPVWAEHEHKNAWN
eukprot:15331527-Ditylum_brightwellii.AAC.1